MRNHLTDEEDKLRKLAVGWARRENGGAKRSKNYEQEEKRGKKRRGEEDTFVQFHKMSSLPEKQGRIQGLIRSTTTMAKKRARKKRSVLQRRVIKCTSAPNEVELDAKTWKTR